MIISTAFRQMTGTLHGLIVIFFIFLTIYHRVCETKIRIQFLYVSEKVKEKRKTIENPQKVN